ncbi:MAG TPA: hypothetical protein VJ255_06240 [Candidatus Acidoferrum sp.]|nr:hypothetical protein [Candidatus Acidoferrum sp.]
MRHLALDIQALGVCIEDQRATNPRGWSRDVTFDIADEVRRRYDIARTWRFGSD